MEQILGEENRSKRAGEPNESPDEEHDADDECHENDGCLTGLVVDFADDGLIVVEETVDENHVALVGLVEEVDDVAYKKGQQAQENVAQRVVENGQRERYGAQPECGKVDVDNSEEGRDDVTNTARNDSCHAIEVVAVHPLRDSLHGLVEA